MIFHGPFGIRNYVSMKKRGTRCIAPKLCGAHFEGSLIPRIALWRLQNSTWQKCIVNLSHRVLKPSKCALRNYGVFKVRPAGFWSNATCALLSHGDIVTGAKIPRKIILNLDFSYFVSVIFVNHCHFRDLYNQYANFLRKKYFRSWYL